MNDNPTLYDLKAQRDALRLELAAKESELLFQSERIININACNTVEHRRKDAVIAALRAELATFKQYKTSTFREPTSTTYSPRRWWLTNGTEPENRNPAQ